jgi:hypothetical protein
VPHGCPRFYSVDVEIVVVGVSAAVGRGVVPQHFVYAVPVCKVACGERACIGLPEVGCGIGVGHRVSHRDRVRLEHPLVAYPRVLIGARVVVEDDVVVVEVRTSGRELPNVEIVYVQASCRDVLSVDDGSVDTHRQIACCGVVKVFDEVVSVYSYGKSCTHKRAT